MNQLQQAYAGGQVAQAGPAQLSLNEKLQTLAGHARNMSQMAFEIGSRLGALQAVPMPGSTVNKAPESHVTSLVNDLDAALSQLNDDLNRIRAFVG